jgi:Fe-S cluster assembly scaffold protein SufB
VRAELEALRRDMQQGLANAQPYPEWPDEYAEPAEAAAQLRLVAETAFTRGDVDTFQRAIGAWEEADPLSAGMYRDLKEMQIAQAMAAQQAPVGNDEATLQAGVQEIRTKYPQFQDESFQAAVAAELDKTPSLKAVLWEGVPGVTVEERLRILDEAAERVVARTTSETAQQARRRIAIRTSEEARAARVAAQTLRPDKARETVEETPSRTIAMGESGRVLDIDRLNRMLPETDRI